MTKQNRKTKVVKKKLDKNIFKKSSAVFLKTLFLLLLSFLSLYFILVSVENRTSSTKPLISFNKNNSVHYRVNLKENEYYLDSSIDMNQKYFADLVNDIEIDFSHSNFASTKYNYNYKTKKTATIYLFDKGGENKDLELWKKEYIFDESSLVFGTNELNYTIKDSININYDDFDKVVKDFQNKFALSTTSFLRVSFSVIASNTIKGYGLPHNTVDELIVDIPLNERVFTISTNAENKTEDIKSVSQTVEAGDSVLLFIGIIGLAASIILIINVLIKYIREEKQESLYLTTLNKILANYGDVIVQTTNKVDFKNMIIIEVESFDELMDAQNELRIPIAYFELVANEKSAFVIVDQKQVWRYTLSSKQLDKSKSKTKK